MQASVSVSVMDKWTIFFILAVLSSVVSAFGVAQLKKRHPEKYADLGNPKPYWNGSAESAYYVTYIISFRFLELKDSFLRAVFLADVLIFLSALVMFASLLYGMFL